MGVPPEQEIANAAADEERLVAGVLQTVHDLERVLGDVGPGDVVLGPWDDLRRVLNGLWDVSQYAARL